MTARFSLFVESASDVGYSLIRAFNRALLVAMVSAVFVEAGFPAKLSSSLSPLVCGWTVTSFPILFVASWYIRSFLYSGKAS